MCAPVVMVGMMVVAAAMAAKSASDQANAQKSAANYQVQVANQNMTLANEQASTAITQGQTDEQNQQLKNAQVYSQQRAAMASNGIDLSQSGSATDVLATTKFLGEKDVLQIHDNALKQAWGYQVQGTNAENQANFYNDTSKSINPNEAAASAGISGAASVASKWYSPDSVGSVPNAGSIGTGAGNYYNGATVSTTNPY